MRQLLMLITAFAALGAAAQDGESDENTRRTVDIDAADREPQRCIRTNRIRRTKVIDDRTIAFYMRNREVFLNTLESRCPRLDTEERFAYSSRAGQLCDTDVITVLVQFAGRLESGFTCRLGQYVPTNADTIELMIEAVESGGATPPYSGEAVELPPEYAEEEAATDDSGDTGEAVDEP